MCQAVPALPNCTAQMRQVLGAPADSSCVNVSFALGLLPADTDSKEQLWKDAFRIFQEHINGLGGLRLGENVRGYVDLVTCTRSNKEQLKQLYRDWGRAWRSFSSLRSILRA